MKRIKTRGVELATQSFGTAQKGTILLVMGATASMAWWPDSFCQTLAEGGYQTIRFDHRDTGQSTTAEPGQVTYDLADLAGDLIAILDGYGLASAHIVGMSLGGLLGQLVALQNPERVSTLTLIASEPLGIAYQNQGISPAFLDHFATMETLDWTDHAAVAAFMLTIARLSAGSAPPFAEADSSARITKELERSSNMKSAFNHALIAGALPPEFTANALRLPVLIIHGTQDPIIAFTAAKALQSASAGAQLMALEGRGHELAPQDLNRISTAILDFIQDQHRK